MVTSCARRFPLVTIGPQPARLGQTLLSCCRCISPFPQNSFVQAHGPYEDITQIYGLALSRGFCLLQLQASSHPCGRNHAMSTVAICILAHMAVVFFGCSLARAFLRSDPRITFNALRSCKCEPVFCIGMVFVGAVERSCGGRTFSQVAVPGFGTVWEELPRSSHSCNLAHDRTARRLHTNLAPRECRHRHPTSEVSDTDNHSSYGFGSHHLQIPGTWALLGR